jgi:hypothetical protein
MTLYKPVDAGHIKEALSLPVMSTDHDIICSGDVLQNCPFMKSYLCMYLESVLKIVNGFVKKLRKFCKFWPKNMYSNLCTKNNPKMAFRENCHL